MAANIDLNDFYDSVLKELDKTRKNDRELKPCGGLEISVGFAFGIGCCCNLNCSWWCGLYTCGTCEIPEGNLTLSWVNTLLGNGSTTLTYTPTGTWVSECVNNLQFVLLCSQGQVELRVIFYLTGSCPTGQSEYCSNLLTAPLSLFQESLSCSPSFQATYQLNTASCPTLVAAGYSEFNITAGISANEFAAAPTSLYVTLSANDITIGPIKCNHYGAYDGGHGGNCYYLPGPPNQYGYGYTLFDFPGNGICPPLENVPIFIEIVDYFGPGSTIAADIYFGAYSSETVFPCTLPSGYISNNAYCLSAFTQSQAQTLDLSGGGGQLSFGNLGKCTGRPLIASETISIPAAPYGGSVSTPFGLTAAFILFGGTCPNGEIDITCTISE